MNKSNAEIISQALKSTCENKGYQVQISDIDHGFRIEISNLKDRVIVNVFFTGKILVQGKETPLLEEIKGLEKSIEKDPIPFVQKATSETKACITKYDIMLSDMRNKIKESISSIATIEVIDNPTEPVEYRAQLTQNSFSLTITQFKNGTLILQGKADNLHSDCCDMVEKLASPSDKDVISRFLSSDEESLKHFTAKYTPELITIAEESVKSKLNRVFDYLELYDKKWFIAAECLSLAGIPLPEHSPIVMPASKAFEGFAKKLLVDIGLYPADYFKKRSANLRKELMVQSNPQRVSICKADSHCEAYLKKLDVAIDMYRNFMMHSEESKVTKVETIEEAVSKLDDIYKNTKEIFSFFNSVFSVLP